jgi:hypothetical protein
MAMADSISFSCSEWGSSQLVFPNDSPEHDDIISCARCGVEIRRYADVRTDRSRAEIDKLLEQTVGNALGPRGRANSFTMEGTFIPAS